MKSKLYFIWSIEHQGWWAPNSLGYTNQVGKAGVYAEDAAKEIVYEANRRGEMNECMIPIVAFRTEELAHKIDLLLSL